MTYNYFNQKLKQQLIVVLFIFTSLCIKAQAPTTATVTFSSGVASWTVPQGVTTLTVECWGGGGSGGGINNTCCGGGGGAGGAYAQTVFTVTPTQLVYYSVAATRAGTSAAGSVGFDSWFNKNVNAVPTVATDGVLAKGGQGGGIGPSGVGGTGSIASCIGTVKYSGGNGAVGTTSISGGGGSGAGSTSNGSNASGISGGVATGGGGAGGAGRNAVGPGNSGLIYGGGGSGGCALVSASTQNGGNGAAGVVRISYVPANFRTVASGNWNTASIWQYSTDGTNWTNATASPNSNDGTITIQNTHTVTVTAALTVDELTVNSGANVVVNSGITLTIANGTAATDAQVDGTLTNAGTVTTTGVLAFGTTGTYEHNQNGGSIPTATWDAASNCNISGITSTALTSGTNQNFGNFTWNCSTQSIAQTLASGFGCQGNYTQTSSNGQTLTTGGNVTIGGNMTITGGTFAVGVNFSLGVTGATSVTSTLTLAGTGAKTFTGDVTINSGGTINETGIAAISFGANFTNNGTFSTTSNTTGVHTFSGASAVIAGTGTISIPYLTFSGGGTKTLNTPLTVSAVLTLTSGVINTSATNLLSVTATDAGAVTGAGSTTNMIDGPLKWYMTTGTTYVFPVGDGGNYYPLTLSTVTGTSPIATVQAYNSGSGGTYSSGSVSSSEHWKIDWSGSSVTGAIVKLERAAAIGNMTLVGTASTANGAYSSLGGTVSGTSITATSSVGTVSSSTKYYAFCSTAPANDLACNATDLGTLPTPGSCVSGLQNGSPVTLNNQSTVGATATTPYIYQTSCQGGGNQPSPALDTWYSFVASGYIVNVQINGFPNASVAIWSGSSCSNLTGLGCSNIPASGTGSLTINSATIGTRYWIQVSGGNSSATSSNFSISVDNDIDCNKCLVSANLTANPAPVNGGYVSGQVVRFCYTVNNWNEINTNWFHGVQITMGSGWTGVISNTTPSPECSYTVAGGSGQWAFYNSVTGGGSGQTFGRGFYFDNSSVAGNNPGQNYGDPTNGSCTWTFYWDLTVGTCAANTDLSVTVNTTGDGESGSWANTGCAGDISTVFSAVGKDEIPVISGPNSICTGTNSNLTSSVSNCTWTSSNSTIATVNSSTGLVTALTAGNTIITCTSPAGCSSNFNLTVLATPTATANNSGPYCSGQTISLNSTGGNTYSWSGPNGYTSNLQNPTISNSTTSMAGNYIVVVTSSNGCSITQTTNVTINPIPTITATTPASRCDAGTVILGATASAGSINWYSASTGGTSIATGTSYTTPSISATTTYYADATASGCTTGTRTAVVATVNPITTITSQSTAGQTVCLNGAFSPLSVTATGANLTYQWYSVGYPSGTVICNYPTEIKDVTSVTGKVWMDRNLGASQKATSSTDANAYGDLYQWGRGSDGHQCRNSPNTSTLSSSDQPGNSSFILAPNSPNDWRSPQNINLWQGINGINNPCPRGYRIPTFSEVDTERASWSNQSNVGAFSSPLKLPVSGFRRSTDGTISSEGVGGYYWTNTINSNVSRYIRFISTADMLTNFRAEGLSIRCIKESIQGTSIGGATGSSYTPSASTVGANNYYVIVTGTCGIDTSTVSGSLIVNPSATITLTSAVGTNAQTKCINTALTNITYATTNATGATVTGLPSGVTGNWASNVFTISGTPTVAGTFNYSVKPTGCAFDSATGTITVNPLSVGGTATAISGTICTGSSTILNLTGNTGIVQWQQSANGTTGWANVIGGSGSNTATYTTPNLSVITYYRASVTSGACATSNSTSAMITINPLSVGGSIAGGATVCSGTNSTTLTLSGHTGTITKWQSTTDGGSTWTDIANTTTSYTATNLTATTQYRAVVTSGACAPANSSWATITVNALPSVSVSGGGTVCVNSTQVLTSSVSGGAGTASYQWESSANGSTGWTNVSGATSSSYTAPTSSSGSTYYRVIVSFTGSGCGSATSNIVSVTIPGALTSGNLSNTTNVTGCVGYITTLTLTVNAPTGGNSPYVYQWNLNNNPISGATSSSYAVPSPVNTAGTYSYNCTTTDACDNSVTSASKVYTIVDDPTITTQPAISSTVCLNGTLNLSVTATGGTPSLTYQWYSNTTASTTGGTLIPGEINSTFTVPTSTSGTKYYYCKVDATGVGCSITTSSVATVTVNGSITLNSAVGTNNQSVCINSSITSITYSTTGATGATFAGLPTGVSGTWGADLVTISGTPTTSGAYVYTITPTGGCSGGSATGIITVNPNSVGGSIAGSASVCTGTNNTTLTLSGQTGSVTKWQSTTDGGSTWTDIANTTTSYTATNLTATTQYRAVVTSGACASANSSWATITVNPNSVGGSIAGSSTVCTGTNSTTLTLGGQTGSVTKWQSTTDGGSTWTDIANTTTSYTATNLIATTQYRAVVTSGACAPANSSWATITVNPNSVGGSISGGATVCTGTNSTTLTLSGQTGSVTKWQSTTDGGSTWADIANTTTSYTATNLTVTTQYRAVVTSGACASANSSWATITVNPTTTITSQSTAGQTVCLNGTFSPLSVTATGANLTYQWYSVGYPSGTVICNFPTEIKDVTNPYTGKTWMDRNLGASQVATSSTDDKSYGDLYQWGRGSDGHQCRNSSTTSTLSSSDQPGNGNFILAPNSPFDWINPQNTNLWQGVSGINNPCPNGYRLPTEFELDNERLSWVQAPISSTNNTVGAFSSSLKLTLSGRRNFAFGSPINVNTYGYYWSSSINNTASSDLYFYSSDAGISFFNRASGLTIRCIKESNQGTSIGGATGSTYTPSSTVVGANNYYVIVTGTCGSDTSLVSGSLIVNPSATIVLTSAVGTNAQTKCVNTAITNITYSTTAATGVTVTGLPAGVTGTWASNVFTISGTPTVVGTFNYTVKPTGCAFDSATGTITVNPLSVGGSIAGGATVCAGTNSTTLTLSGQTGSVTKWQSTTDGGSTWTDIANTTTSYTATNLTVTTQYRAVVTSGACASANSSWATITVFPVPSISTQPSAVTECVGGTDAMSVVASGGTPSLTYQWYSNASNNNFGGTLISGATNNTYTLDATTAGTTYYYVAVSASGSGCSSVISNAVLGTIFPVPSISTQPSAVTECVGGTDAMNVVASGGTPSLTYQWYSNASNNNFSGTLISGATNNTYTPDATTAGTTYYYVAVSASGSGCSSVISNAVLGTITAPPTASISYASSSFPTSASAQTVTLTGTNAYTGGTYSSGPGFTINSSTGTITPNSSAPGTYTITYTTPSSGGCAAVTTTVAITITNNPITDIAITNTSSTCGNNNGSITLSAVTGGVSPYTYSLNGGTFTSTTSYTSLAAGTYTITVQDANASTYTKTTSINNIAGPTALAVTPTNATCGNANGTLSIGAVTGGVSPYTYSVTTVSAGFNATTNYSNLSSGTYTVTVKDVNNCTYSVTTTVNNIAGPTAVAVTPTNASCGNANGALSIGAVTGGVSPYTYSVTTVSGSFSSTTSYTGLNAGTFTVNVKDANNCVYSTTTTVNNTNGPTANAGSSLSQICQGSTTPAMGGSVGGDATGGTWSGGAGTWANANDPVNATYTAGLTETDTITLTLTTSGGSCGTVSVTKTVRVISATKIVAQNTNSQSVCLDGNLSPLSVTASGDNLTYQWYSIEYPTGSVFCNGPTDIVDVTNPVTGKTWMDRNLGASRAAQSSTDSLAYGDLYQWGRGNDGHQCRNSSTTSTLSSIDQPGNSSFILDTNAPNDWRNPQNDNLWQGISGVNNPCPSGYRLPSEIELNNERLSWVQAPISSTNTSNGAFASPLKLPLAGIRSFDMLLDVGYEANYWSSSVSSNNSSYFTFNIFDAGMNTYYRSSGLSVRCIKESTSGNSINGATGSTYTPSSSTVGATYYYVIVSGTCGADTSSNSGAISVNPNPSVSLLPSNVLCNGASTGSINNTNSGGTSFTYNWQDSNFNTISTNQNLENVPAGTYTVQVTNNFGCSATATETIAEPPLFTAFYNGVTTLCNGSALIIVLNASGGTPSYNYTWQATDNPSTVGETTTTVSSSIINDTLFNTNTNNEIVTYNFTAFDEQGCVYNSSINVNVLPTLAIQANASATQVCSGSTVTLSGSGNATNYTWNNGVTNGVAFTPTITQYYQVIGTDSNNCVGMDSILITVNPLPEFTINSFETNQLPGYIPQQGLVAWWPLNGNANDVSGNGNNGILNGPTPSVDKNGVANRAYTFNGINEFIDLSNVNFGITGNQNRTIVAWAKTNNQYGCILSSGNSSVLVCDNSNNGKTFNMFNYPDRLGLMGFNCGNCATCDYFPTSGQIINNDIWNFLVISLRNDSLFTYVNGILDNSTYMGNGTINTINNSNFIGKSNHTGYEYFFNGSLDDIGIWNRALTQQEINDLYTAGQTSDTICSGNSINLQANGNYNFSWSPDSLTTSAITVSPATTTVYTLTATSSQGCQAQQTYTVVVNPLFTPQVTASVNDSAICVGNQAQFTVSLSNGGATPSLQWYINNNPVAGANDTVFVANSLSNNDQVSVVLQSSLTGCVTSNSDTSNVISMQVANQTAVSSQLALPLVCSNTSISQVIHTTTGVLGIDTVTGLPPGLTITYSNDSLYLNGNAQLFGTYNYQVILNGTCAKDTAFGNIEIKQKPNIIILGLFNVRCYNDSTGGVSVMSTGGYAPYNYAINGGQFQNTTLFSGLVAGTYTISVRDSFACSMDTTFSINQATQMLPSITAQTNVSCNGLDDGAATVTCTGGSGPYTYVWNTNPIQTGSVAINLFSGSYIVSISDTNNCQTQLTVNITQPFPFTATTSFVNNIGCNGPSIGSAAVSANGGVPPYYYSWSTTPIQTTDSAFNLAAGNYTVSVYDSNNCTATTTVNISQSSAPNAIATSTNINCNGNANGTASVSVNGGTAPFTYEWNTTPVQTTPSVSNLAAGNYMVIVRDSSNCRDTAFVSVSEPQAIVASITKRDITCFGNTNGSVIISTTGGIAPYTYLLNSSQVTDSIFGLSAGNYSLAVTDANSCIVTNSITITEPQLLNVSIVAQTNVVGAGVNNGTATASVNGGITPYAFSWSHNSSTNSNFVNDLPAGTHTVTVTDNNNCSDTATVIITEQSYLLSENIITKTNVPVTLNIFSNDVGFTGLITDTLPVLNTNHGTLSIQQNGDVRYTPAANFSGYDKAIVKACTPLLQVCLFDTIYITVKPNAQIDLFTTNGFANAAVATGNVLANDAGSGIQQSAQLITSVSNGTVTLDANGNFLYRPTRNYCGLDSFKYEICDTNNLCAQASCIFEVICRDVTVFTGFSPNGDGINDNWVIADIEGTNNTVSIFDRWGRMVKTYTNYDNVNVVWDGTNTAGVLLSSGTYFYAIEVENKPRKLGWIEITR